MIAHTAFARHLDRDQLLPVYLFVGSADLLMEEAWEQLAAGLIPPVARHCNGERLWARECAPELVVERLSMRTMFGGTRVVMVRQVEAWSADQRKVIAAYAAAPHPTTCLVLTAESRKGLAKLEAAVEAAGMVVKFDSPKERDIPRRLQERVRQQGRRLAPAAASLLVELVGTELHRLERELEKLCAYVGERELITEEDVHQTVALQRTFSVFELVRHAVEGRAGPAMASLRALLLAGDAPLAILALIARQVRLLWQVKDGQAQGLSQAQLSQRLKLPPFVVKNVGRQAMDFRDADLRRLHEAVRQADLAMKSSGVSAEMILVRLILDRCRRPAHAGAGD